MEATVYIKYLKEVYNNIPSHNKIQRIVIWYDVKTEFMAYYKKCDHFNYEISSISELRKI